MSLFRAVLAELLGMFLSDARLSIGALAVVVAAAVAADLAPEADALLAGGVLLVGCLAVLVAAVMARARRP